ncbi:waprin-Rha1-like isoform X2 [Podarcis muralis]
MPEGLYLGSPPLGSMTLPAGSTMKLVLTVCVLLLGLSLELFGPNSPSAAASPLPKTISQDKPGTCPSLSIGISMLGACHNACEVDSNCPGDKKCCQNGCGKLACSTPEF